MINKAKGDITSITINTATYHNEKLNPTLINFFFGNNGCGKSSLARFIYELKDKYPNNEFLIYDSKYKKENIKNLKGIFTLNKKNLELENKIAENKKKIDDELANIEKNKAEIDRIDSSITKEAKEYQEQIKKISEPYKEKFPKAFKGRSYANKIVEKLNEVKQVDHDINDIKKLYETAYGNETNPLNKLQHAATAIKSFNMAGRKLINISIVGSQDTDFAKFVKKLGAQDWVQVGYNNYLNDDGLCPFCQRKLENNFEDKIKQCFDESYTENIQEFLKFAGSYSTESQEIIAILKSNLNLTIPFEHEKEYKDKVSIIEKTITNNLLSLSAKKKEPSSKHEFYSIDEQLQEINNLITSINNEIQKHNDIILSKETNKVECTNQIFELINFNTQNLKFIQDQRFAGYNKVKNELLQSCENSANIINSLQNEIANANKNTVNTSKVVEDINNLLGLSGYQGFYIKELTSDNGISKYTIVREDGTLAENNLSEGEENFIAFLYFYFQVKYSATETPNDRKIVIIDDPVSSMDTNSLYIISSLIKELINICANTYELFGDENLGDFISQIFILTHNIYFHNEITQNFNTKNEYVYFFTINKENNKSTIHNCINIDKDNNEIIYNPISNSYTLLWQEYRETTSPILKLNAIKRILDYYFIQFSGYKEEKLLDLINKNEEQFIMRDPKTNEVIDTNNLKWARMLINQISSYGRFQEDIYYSNITTTTMPIVEAVFKQIFIALEQEQHYNMMMQN